ncbi:uncharacterized protein FA14DRAFT_170791 [Meira miltonrushii]|uniref:Uncharacterized protein n=1 Tax=Meira miltonrushii TaxID=1280837 RepID=A0A316VK34_9BASI|nr:uncharacterized protein FA14DRAFT_170791 [Meira miltonrushii]PWN38047.1 hypothetical protein FA14DRAFT_170791 [Meira miltonrushii]
MATFERSLGDITNSVNQLSICTPSKSQPSSSKTTLQSNQNNSSSPIARSPLKQNGSSFDTEESLLTASESDAFTEEDDDENDITSSERGDDENGDISAATYTSKQRSRAPPPIFFGTPSKAEHDRRHKYQAKLRTRRLLRKDSIELTRRKSGGWEGHETITDRTIEDESSLAGDMDAGEYPIKDAREEKEDEESISDSIQPLAEKEELNDEAPSEIVREDQLQDSTSDDDDDRSTSEDQIDLNNDDEAENAASKEEDVGGHEAEVADRKNTNAEESLLSKDDTETIAHEAEGQVQMDCENAEVEQLAPGDGNIANETPEDDPDATEEADWFGIKSGNKTAILPSSPSHPSLPSTPTRQKGFTSAIDRCRTSLAPSEADSSPGIALAPYPFSSRPSPMNFAASRGKGSPYIASPAMSYMSNFSPQFDRENEGHTSQRASVSRSGPILQESARKGNAANSLYSPTKVEVRSKLAAWANAKVKTPQSPEKKEFDAMRLSSIQPESFSPTLKTTAYDLLDIASQVPLPLSPIKTHLRSSPPKRSTTQMPDPTPSLTAQRASPVRSDASLRTSRLPVPAVSKLPRPFKLSVSKSHPQPQNKAVPLFKAKQSAVQKISINGERRPAARPNPSHAPNFASSQASTGSINTKPLRDLEPSMNGRRVLNTNSNPSSSSSSSPTKQVAKANAPIVRDARLIAGRNAKPISSNVKPEIVDLKTKTNQEAANTATKGFVSDAPKAAMMTASKAGSVGGARRVMRGVVAVPKIEQSSQRKTLDENASRAASNDNGIKSNPSRRLGMREAAPVAQLTTTKERNAVKARPMRRINDFIRKVDHSLSSPSRQQGNAPAPESVKPEKSMKEEDTLAGLKSQRTTMGQGLRERTQPEQQSTTKSSGSSSSASSSPKALSLPFKAAAPVTTSVTKATQAPRPIPISSMELSRLTSLHTRCNETGVAQLELIIIRKQGELRPPSPSSKFRKNAEAGNATAALTKAQREAKEAQSKQARKDRAAQRAERLSGGNAADTSSTTEQEDETLRSHRLAAGDEEVYATPPRRISLKKAVRWHKALFAGPSDNISGANRTTKDDLSFLAEHHPKPVKSCLADAGQAALDRFGNVPQAGKPLGSPLVKRKKIIITKIVYDDDDSES